MSNVLQRSSIHLMTTSLFGNKRSTPGRSQTGSRPERHTQTLLVPIRKRFIVLELLFINGVAVGKDICGSAGYNLSLILPSRITWRKEASSELLRESVASYRNVCPHRSWSSRRTSRWNMFLRTCLRSLCHPLIIIFCLSKQVCRMRVAVSRGGFQLSWLKKKLFNYTWSDPPPPPPKPPLCHVK